MYVPFEELIQEDAFPEEIVGPQQGSSGERTSERR